MNKDLILGIYLENTHFKNIDSGYRKKEIKITIKAINNSIFNFNCKVQ